MLNDGAAWLEVGPSGLALMTLACVLLAARADAAGSGSVLLASLAGLLALAIVRALWARWPVRSTGHDTPGQATTSSPAAASDAAPRATLAGLDCAQVLDIARSRFLHLQAAWDAADVAVLRSLTTPEMLAELLQMLDARLAGPSRTDVVSLHAELLGLEELGPAYLACIEFSGLIRESAEVGAVPFRELWMLCSSKDEALSSWRLARQQALF